MITWAKAEVRCQKLEVRSPDSEPGGSTTFAPGCRGPISDTEEAGDLTADEGICIITYMVGYITQRIGGVKWC